MRRKNSRSISEGNAEHLRGRNIQLAVAKEKIAYLTQIRYF